MFNNNHTTLFYADHWDANPCDVCQCHDDEYHDMCGYNYCNCDIKEDPSGTDTKISVRIVGKPVRFFPGDCTYSVRVWQKECVESKRGFCDEDEMIHEFSLESVCDSVDLEHMYSSIVKDYVLLCDDSITISTHTFKAPRAPDKYVNAFWMLANIIILPPTPRITNENAHVGTKWQQQNKKKKLKMRTKARI